MEDKQKKTLSTYVEAKLAEQVEAEAREMRVSTSAVLRWAIMERYRSENKREKCEPVRA